MPDFAIVAIDGPAASGKTTVGRMVAERLGARFFDTGQMYRAVTVAAMDGGVDRQDEEALSELVAGLDMTLVLTRADARVDINGTDVTRRLRQPDVNGAVSQVAASPSVRCSMVERQRAIASEGPIVVVGRDIGSVVLPEAPVKVYLDASPEVRGERRRKELEASGRAGGLDEVIKNIEGRDRIDSLREMSPLRPAEDAVRIDTDGMTVAEVVSAVMDLAATR